MIEIKSKRKPIYLPFHKVVREFDGKLLLACKAAEQGFPIIFGRKKSILKKLLKSHPGIFIDTRLNSSRITMPNKNIKSFKDIGHDIWAFDEEMTTVDDVEKYQKNQISKEVLDHINGVFCWSNHHQSIIKDVHKKVRTYVTGHPRYDMYKSEIRCFYNSEVNRIKKNYGNFILIPSSFGSLALGNSSDLEKQIKINQDKGFFRTESDIQNYRRKMKFRSDTAAYYVDMINRISKKFNEINFILRPHFADPPGFWQSVLNTSEKNLFVIHEGPIAPWILASIGMIHHHCSTSVEAYLFDKPVLSYIPIFKKEYQRELPTLVSKEVYSLSDLESMIELILINNYDHSTMINSDKINKLIDINNDLSTRRIIEILKKQYDINDYNIKIFRKNVVKNKLRDLKYFIINNLRHENGCSEFKKSHEPFIRYLDVKKVILQFQKLDILNDEFLLKQIDNELFLIKSKSKY